MISAAQPPQPWITSFLKWLTPRRLRAQAIVLAICLWGVCAVDFATPGLFDRAGNIKFQDFLPVYISAKLVSQHRSIEIYDPKVQAEELNKIIGQPTRVVIPYLYGPQVGLLFVPLARFSFPVAALLWATTSVLIYFGCVCAIWKRCPGLSSRLPSDRVLMVAALAFPPLFHTFMRGQISSLILACFTAAFLALRAGRACLAGIALGFLILKPQFLVAIPVILLLAGAWKTLLGLLLSSSAQVGLARLNFGAAVTHDYFDLFRYPAQWINAAELKLAPIQMHSLRSFWILLMPSSTIALLLYVLSSMLVMGITVAIWRSRSPIALRFSAITLAAILVDPHLFVYDLLVLAPVVLLLVDWTFAGPQYASTPRLLLFSYLAFVLPLFGPLSLWTHLQISVLVFVGLLWTLRRSATEQQVILASGKSPVV